MTSSNQPLTAILVGAGARGRGAYGQWIARNRDRIRLIAVAEPDAARREGCAREHGIPAENIFRGWEEAFSRERLADICIIATQDTMHTGPALAAMEKGYDVLLEKPMAATHGECRLLVSKSEDAGRELRICHVARYAGFFAGMKRAIADGLIGEIIHINHAENVAYWHFAHGYVRGSWRRADESSPVVLAKTCHDLDLLYWLVEEPADRVHSFGELSYFNRAHAPAGAPERCIDGCPVAGACLYYAPRMYVDSEPMVRVTTLSANPLVRRLGKTAIENPAVIRFLSKFYPRLRTLVDWQLWPTNVITEHGTREEKLEAMRTGPYGRCVFRCDNDVPDHQTVSLAFRGGVTATMAMQGHSYLDGRWIRIDGTLGTISGQFTYAGERLVLHDHRYLGERVLWERGLDEKMHGGGDEGLMESFVNDMMRRREGAERTGSLTSARASLESHLMAFAAEKSRLEGRVVSMEELRR